jgi:predicted permease
VLAAFAPIWALTAVGVLVGLSRALGPSGVDVLGRFVFTVAMPAALFGMLVRHPLGGFAGRGIAAFAVGTALVGLVGIAVARAYGRPLGEQAIAGMAAGYVNAANLGIPIAVQVLGDASFISLVLLLQTAVLAPLVLGTLDIAQHATGAGRWRRLLTLPLRNPILIACVLGVFLGAVGVHLPRPVDDTLSLLGAAAVPTALVALGLSLVPASRRERTPHRPVEVTVSVLLKVVVQPVLTYLVARVGFGLRGAELLAVVLCAGLPTAQNTFVFARAYGVDDGFARDAIVASTALSMLTLTVIATVLE